MKRYKENNLSISLSDLNTLEFIVQSAFKDMQVNNSTDGINLIYKTIRKGLENYKPENYDEDLLISMGHFCNRLGNLILKLKIK